MPWKSYQMLGSQGIIISHFIDMNAFTLGFKYRVTVPLSQHRQSLKISKRILLSSFFGPR